MKQQIDVKEAVFGLDNMETKMLFLWVATKFLDRGKFCEAENLQRRAIKNTKEDSVEALLGMSGLVTTLKMQGKYEEAQKLCRTVLNTRQERYGGKSLDAFESMFQMGEILDMRGLYEEAEVQYRQAAQGFEERLSPEHQETLDAQDRPRLVAS